MPALAPRLVLVVVAASLAAAGCGTHRTHHSADRVAYADARGNLWTMAPDGGDRRRVLAGSRKESAGMPRLAPDGKRMALTLRPAGSTSDAATLAVLDLRTRRLTRLFTRSGLSDVGWLPDGSRILFGVQGSLLTADARGRGVRPFARGACPVFSPRGDLVVVCRPAQGSPDATTLVALDRDGRVVRRLFTRPDFATPGGISPDGRRMVVSSGGEGQADLFLVDLATGRSRVLLRKGGSQVAEGWLPSGKIVVADTDGLTGRTKWELLDPQTGKLRHLPAFARVTDPVDWWTPARPRPAGWGQPTVHGRTSFVRIGDRQLSYACAGHGSPTVVLDSGLGVSSQTWARVQRSAARFTRVCRYDRAGLGLSDPASGQHDSAHAVADLRALLRAISPGRPVVGVGASFGGLNLQLLAATAPRLVRGLVLVDSLHPRFDAQIEPLLQPGERAARRSELERNAEGLRFADIVRSEQQVARAEARPGIPVPVVVLRHGVPFAGGPRFPSARVEALWKRLQLDLAARSPQGSVVLAKRSGHRIAETEPDLVVAAIRRLAASRSQPRLAGRIAYSDAHGRLWVMRADGRGRHALPHRAGDVDFDPSLSPDGHRIVFRTARDDDGIPDPTGIGLDPISVVNVASGRRRTISGPTGGLFPAWSPDGRTISVAGVRRTGERLDRVWLIRPDGTGRRLLVDHPGEDTVWSPDGRRIAFGSHDGDGNWQVWRVDRDGRGLRKLTRDADHVQHPGAWSPDGARIAFSSDRAGNTDVYLMDADGRHERPLVSGPHPEAPVAWVLPGWILVSVAVDSSVLPRWELVSIDGRRRVALPQLRDATSPVDWIVPRRRSAR